MLNVLAPRNGVAARQAVAYGPGPRRMLDVYAPAGPASRSAHPVVVFIYGGGWIAGDRSAYRFFGASLAARGVVVVVPDYRLHPEVKFPAFVEDAAAALAWTKAHIADYGGDARNIFVMGHSAGGQIAALLAFDPQYLAAVGMTPAMLSGFIGLAGAYDFLPLTDPVHDIIFGPADRLWRSQPINFVTEAAPPAFLATGPNDKTVLPRNSFRLADRLRELGRPVTLNVYPHVGHATLLGAFAVQLGFLAPVRKDVLAFIAAHPAPPDQPISGAVSP